MSKENTVRPVVIVCLVLWWCVPGCHSAPDALERARSYNGAGAPGPWPAADLNTPGRVGWWARQFLAADAAVYCFGPAEGGYVAEGRLVLDDRHDCISLLYRTIELAHAADPAAAVAWALATRFAGADPDSVVDAAGRVDYDHPAHLDFSIDMIRSGHWGCDVTGTLRGAGPETVGTPRYPAGAVMVVPRDRLVPGELCEGDVAWFVLDPADPRARVLRDTYGLMIGHVGLVILEGTEPWLVHAASSGLPGHYEGGRIVAVPLVEYLKRVERYGAVIITRFADGS